MANKQLIIILLSMLALTAMGQAPRSSYGLDGFSFGHELNPAIAPDTSYWSLPVLGNASFSMASSMKLGDLFYEKNSGTITTYMNSETISKQDLMDKVGKGLNTCVDVRMTLGSFGRRVNGSRYQYGSLTWRTQADMYMDKGLFDVTKDVENRQYTIGRSSVRASSYMELAYGEAISIDKQWTVGAKAKLLLGLVNMNAEVEHFDIDLSDGTWRVRGLAKMDVSGLSYKTTEKAYNAKAGTYTMVNGCKLGSLGVHGLGVAVDAGVHYKLDDNWSFSAAALDLGFMTWIKSRQAENSGEEFVFDGIHDASRWGNGENSFENQLKRFGDQLIDMAHLEETSTGCKTRLLACTLNAGATYRYDRYTASALLTSRVYGRNSSVEGRVNLSMKPIDVLDVTVSPAVSTYGFALGGMVRWRYGRYQVYAATDCYSLKINRQFIPTSLNSTVNVGVSIALAPSRTTRVVEESVPTGLPAVPSVKPRKGQSVEHRDTENTENIFF